MWPNWRLGRLDVGPLREGERERDRPCCLLEGRSSLLEVYFRKTLGPSAFHHKGEGSLEWQLGWLVRQSGDRRARKVKSHLPDPTRCHWRVLMPLPAHVEGGGTSWTVFRWGFLSFYRLCKLCSAFLPIATLERRKFGYLRFVFRPPPPLRHLNNPDSSAKG